MKTLIEVKNLSVDFPMGKTKGKKNFLSAVSDATFCVNRGDIFGIVGESGCGKSTLINAILGFCDITGGSVSVMGNELSCKTPKAVLRNARKHMQVVFQNPYTSLNPRLEVHEIVSEPLYISGIRDKKLLFQSALDMLIKVGMTEQDAKRNIFEFSGGQRQRIAIARALITKPDILMLDEPVSALDLSVHAQICNLLLDLKDEFNLTYIFVSHNLSLIKHICNKTCVMYLGQIIELGDSKEVFKNPRHPYTKALLSSVLDIHSQPKASTLIGELSSPINIGKECRFYTRCQKKCEQCKNQNISLNKITNEHLSACPFCDVFN